MNNKRRRRAIEEQAAWRFRRHQKLNLLATPGQNDLIIVLDHLKSDYNIGKIFRSADAFAAREVHLVGIDSFDPAPAMGSFKWVPAHFFRSFTSCWQNLIERGYTVYALDPGSQQALSSVQFPAKSAFVFGHEEYGLSFDVSEFSQLQTLAIPQFGKVQSLNVSIAASIVMYDYVRQVVL